jgi:hypothetical protein
MLAQVKLRNHYHFAAAASFCLYHGLHQFDLILSITSYYVSYFVFYLGFFVEISLNLFKIP